MALYATLLKGQQDQHTNAIVTGGCLVLPSMHSNLWNGSEVYSDLVWLLPWFSCHRCAFVVAYLVRLVTTVVLRVHGSGKVMISAPVGHVAPPSTMKVSE